MVEYITFDCFFVSQSDAKQGECIAIYCGNQAPPKSPSIQGYIYNIPSITDLE